MSALGSAIPFSPETNSPIINESPMAHFVSDGLNLSPSQYLKVLNQIIETKGIKVDNYSLEGIVEEFEQKFAKLVGKEMAIFLPTGTLANQLAIRKLCGDSKRAIVQNQSHIYNDSGDCVQSLSQINLVPLGHENASFSLEDVQELFQKNETNRVKTNIGMISIESPVRRKTGELFDFVEMQKISAFAKEKNIKMHLDGARIFLASAYTGIKPTEYASHFDTVYVSLYKYFNAASGAILAGPKSVIEGMFHTRRMFGSGLHQSWPFVAVADYFMEGFEKRYTIAKSISDEFIQKLKTEERFKVNRIENGSNIFNLELSAISAQDFSQNLKKQNILANPKNKTSLNLLVNESLNSTSANELFTKFKNALKQ
ncbi:aminotransferase class I/II-fold pyridoxal phosphate-dependent enzyme [Lacihabitans sp. CS3-21]|nr:aminotransferase class I/II-fold pyridoxal phosphate-dependent enzyme [Lacihabitans sp. CS3-21]